MPEFDFDLNLKRKPLKMHKVCIALIAAIALNVAPAKAHEVWIEPAQWTINVGSEVAGQILNGQNLKGIKLSWNDKATLRAEKWQGADMEPIVGRLGDVPALRTAATEDGLVTLLYQSGLSTITYKEHEKFASFVTEKGHQAILDAHAARGLPQAPIKEAYSRFAKALIAVGTGQGQDAARGLELEIVALTNPYRTPLDQDLRFQLLYQGAPLVNNRVTVFARQASGEVTENYLQTDGNGEVSFKQVAGRIYLVDSVLLREPAREVVAETRGAIWESLWASLTFRTPDAQ
ncbi:DUF4198 domain-containing protein [Sulfitobacter sp. F26204]|uniref:DUF4198 domain-containing protein n=1 Tax=Sulfitobacter sp. F26204 TaxID=2996014 RepID=UPI00225E3752|nr:DUF4198 domain-containing protein [Sulfitobacter sp. F26204]MCX7560533.1 DUF4198 domain-containing protein [Sulfitobacter sp. F26204]